jgi:hypothetical protein
MDRWRRRRNDYINLETDQLSREIGQSLGLGFTRAKLQDDVLAFDVSELAQTSPKSLV